MRRLGFLLPFAAGLALLSTATSARADETATYCSETDLQCTTAPIAFSKEVVLPVQGGFDTGWVPQNSALQVHLFAQLWANTHVDLAGHFETTWPDALTLATPPEPGTGSMGIHYGVDIGAEAHIEFTVLGQQISWTGPIPFVPQFDFQVEANGTFDPWGFDGFSINGSTMEQTIAQISAEDFIGVDIPGLDGGFELNTFIDLTATYQTTHIEILRMPDGTMVEGGPITSDTDTSLDGYVGEPGVDYAIRPVGEIVYKGTLHLIPAFYIDTIGPDFSIPIADIPIPFEFSDRNWEFDYANVHVPLPDVEVDGDPVDLDPDAPIVIDLGTIEAGTTIARSIAFGNVGEALLAGVSSIGVDGPEPTAFTIGAASFDIDPGAETTLGYTFAAQTPGDYVGTLTLASNDPDEPARVIQIQAHIEEPPVVTDDDDDDDGDSDGDVGDFFAEGGGCHCRAAAPQPSSAAWLGFLAIGAVGLRRRRGR